MRRFGGMKHTPRAGLISEPFGLQPSELQLSYGAPLPQMFMEKKSRLLNLSVCHLCVVPKRSSTNLSSPYALSLESSVHGLHSRNNCYNYQHQCMLFAKEIANIVEVTQKLLAYEKWYTVTMLQIVMFMHFYRTQVSKHLPLAS